MNIGWNGGSWIMANVTTQQPRWIDPLVAWHDGGSILGFADGHARRHRWIDESTLEMSRLATEGGDSPFYYPINWSAGEGADVRYMAKHYVPGEDVGE